MKPTEHYFLFGNETSLQNGLLIENKDIYGAAEPDLDEYEIPKRDGTVYIDRGRYKNVTVSYDTFLKVPDEGKIYTYADNLKRWLLRAPALYKRLEDSFDLDHFRKAVYTGGLHIESPAKGFLKQTIEFSCLPYRYLKTGEQKVYGNRGDTTMYNGTGFTSEPLILLRSTYPSKDEIRIRIRQTIDGEKVDKNYYVTGFTEEQNLIYIDSEAKTVYGLAQGPGITETATTEDYMKDDLYPIFPDGEFEIFAARGGFGSSFYYMDITPRWRCL